jgi:chromosome segregation ATPase
MLCIFSFFFFFFSFFFRDEKKERKKEKSRKKKEKKAKDMDENASLRARAENAESLAAHVQDILDRVKASASGATSAVYIDNDDLPDLFGKLKDRIDELKGEIEDLRESVENGDIAIRGLEVDLERVTQEKCDAESWVGRLKEALQDF